MCILSSHKDCGVSMARSIRSLGRISPKSSALLVCDLQEKFRAYTCYFPQIIKTTQRMLAAAKILQIPVLATEQYPKGLGRLVPELDLKSCHGRIYEKTCFSMASPTFEEILRSSTTAPLKSVLLCGIEAHACIFQTTLDLLERQLEVHLVVDAVSSRTNADRLVAFRRLERTGAFLTTSESVLLELLRDAAHPEFKQIQKLLVDQTGPDEGLSRGI